MPTASRIEAVQYLPINYLLAFPVFSPPRRARWSLKRGGDQREVSKEWFIYIGPFGSCHSCQALSDLGRELLLRASREVSFFCPHSLAIGRVTDSVVADAYRTNRMQVIAELFSAAA